MALTDDETVHARMKDLMRCDNREEPGEFYTYHLADMNAALGLAQLEKLDSFLQKRKELCSRYITLLSEAMPTLLMPAQNKPTLFRYIIRHPDAQQFIERMRKRGADCARPVYRPLHRYLSLDDKEFPHTIDAFSRSVSIPLYPGLKSEDQLDIVSMIVNDQMEKAEEQSN